MGSCFACDKSSKYFGIKEDGQLTLWSGNCYAFPQEVSDLLEFATTQLTQMGIMPKPINLNGDVKKDVSQRINEIAQLVIKNTPDVVAFQELWGDRNKQLMQNVLNSHYSHFYWQSILKQDLTVRGLIEHYKHNEISSLPVKLDSGLFVASRFPIINRHYFEFTDKAGDEVNAMKGAYILHMIGEDKSPILFATTHLQSWRDVQYVSIRQRQMKQLGQTLSAMRTNWGLDGQFDLKIIIVGDLNEPIVILNEEHLMVNYSKYLVETLNSCGLQVSDTSTLKLLAKNYAITKTLDVNAIDVVGTLKELDVSIEVKMGEPYSYLVGRFHEHKTLSKWTGATDPKSLQLLDHVYVDRNCQVSDYHVLRDECFGDSLVFDPTKAITDHAHIFFTVKNIAD